MPRRRRAVPSLAVASLVAAACQDATPPTAVQSPIEMRPATQVEVPDPDALARTIPGFGGYFLEDGVPVVYLTDVGQRPAVEAALAGFARANGVDPSAIRVRQGRYAWARLQGWFQRASEEALAHAGVVFVDLDETANRVLVGVENAVGASAARGAAARLGLPAGAVEIRTVEPIHVAATLRDRVRPVVGGLQIHFGNYLCTLGFNAVSGTQTSFITNSHCTSRQGGVEGTKYYQPLSGVVGTSIGTEVADPAYVRKGAGCPQGRTCRQSDAARVAYASGVSFTLGGIAGTTGPNNGSVTIQGGSTISGEGAAIVGQTVNKVGRTTGWTQGQVTNTCASTGVSGTNFVLLCQTFVNAGVGGGDSGSPVFMGTGSVTSVGLWGTSSSVTLVGILWGGNSSGTQFVFSPILNVEQELGPLTTK